MKKSVRRLRAAIHFALRRPRSLTWGPPRGARSSAAALGLLTLASTQGVLHDL